jgi:hypothetical protein
MYFVLGIISQLEMIESMQEDVGRFHGILFVYNTCILLVYNISCKDLSMHRFWYLREILELMPKDIKGELYSHLYIKKYYISISVLSFS